MTQEPHKKPDASEPLVFGKMFTDHMLMVEWAEKQGWGQPRIQPFQNLTLHPACSALHYSQQVARRLASVPVSLCITSLLLCLLPRPPPWVCFLYVFLSVHAASVF